MADESAPTSFNFASMDWDAYIRYRPVYTEEVYSTIYAYHDSHHGAYDSAIDVGAGVGIVSAKLAKRFSHITVTDPSEAYVASAKSYFATFPPGRFDFLQTKAEDISLERLPQSEKVDLVTAGECLHWAAVEIAIPQIASVLKPSGTFAGWLYGVRPLLSAQSGSLGDAREIFYDIYDKMVQEYDTRIEKQVETSGGAAMNARLDHMPFSSDVWTDVRRIHTNTESPMASATWPSSSSKVSKSDKVEKFANERLLSHSADYEYLEGYLVNWIPPIKVKEFAKVELANLKKAMGGQTIDVTWPFVMVLATKK